MKSTSLFKNLGMSRSKYRCGELQSFPHGFLGLWRKKKNVTTCINLYVNVFSFIYSDMNFNIVIVCDIQSSYSVNMVFILPDFFGRLLAEFKYCCVFWSNSGKWGVQKSFDWHILYLVNPTYGDMGPKDVWPGLNNSGMKWFVTCCHFCEVSV